MGQQSCRVGTAELSDAYADALLAADQHVAEELIREAIDAQLTDCELLGLVIAPALDLISLLSQRGLISSGDARVAWAINTRIVVLAADARRVSCERARHGVILASPPGDPHVTLLLADALLNQAGYNPLTLGAHARPEMLATIATQWSIEVIVLHATTDQRAASLPAIIRRVHSQDPIVGFVIAGTSVDGSLRGELQAQPRTRVCCCISEVLHAVDATVQHADLN